VGGKILAVAAGVDVDDVDRLHRIEILVDGELRIGVDDAGVEAGTEDRGDTRLPAFVPALPLVVRIPGRPLADLERVFVDGRIQIGGTGRNTGRKDAHVDEGRADIDD